MKRYLASALILFTVAAQALAQSFTESFDSGIPATWSIVDNFPIPGSPDFSAVPWSTNTPEGMDNFTGQPGQAATASSHNHPGQYDISLITPAFIMPATGGTFSYYINFQRVDAYEAFDTSISINGAAWVTMIHQVTSLGAFYSAAPPNIFVGIDLTFYGAHPGDSVRVEFRYYSTFLLPMVQNEYVEIDNVTYPAPLPDAPANDACASAQIIAAGTYSGTTAAATNDGSTSCGGGAASPDVWYQYTAPGTGTIDVDTCGSTFDTVLSVHGSCPGNAGNTLACNDDNAACGGSPARQSRLTLAVTGGSTYLIRVSGYGSASGAYTLHLVQHVSIPLPNDACLSATGIGDGVFDFDTGSATTDGPAESACSFFGDAQVGHDIWYRYTATCTGTATTSLCGSSFDTKIAAYPTGDCPSAPNTAIACNDDSTCGGSPVVQSSISFPVVAGRSYLLRIGGYGSSTGTGVLATSCIGASTCAADFNQDGVLNADDLGDFITGYFDVPAEPRTDFNGDTVINADDLGDFITAYFNGC